MRFACLLLVILSGPCGHTGIANAADDESAWSVDPQGEPRSIVPRANRVLMLDSHDQQLVEAASSMARDLGQVELASTMQKADGMFKSILDPRNEQTKKMINDLLHEPMTKLYSKFSEAVMNVDVKDPVAARESIEVARELLKFSAEAREMALDHVYDSMQRQVDSFSTSVDVYNKKMKETLVQALDIYRQQGDAMVEMRSKALKQKQEEHAFMLAASANETEVQAARERTKLAVQKERDDLGDARERRAIEREEQRAAADLEKQRRKDEQEHLKAERELERDRKRDQAEHDKALKKLEALAKKGQIASAEREVLMRELAIEMARYNKEFDLAQQAMKTALTTWWRTCQINHVAPKIEWGKPPDEPARVVPGYVHWTLH